MGACSLAFRLPATGPFHCPWGAVTGQRRASLAASVPWPSDSVGSAGRGDRSMAFRRPRGGLTLPVGMVDVGVAFLAFRHGGRGHIHQTYSAGASDTAEADGIR